MDQFTRVATIAQQLRSFKALVEATAEKRGSHFVLATPTAGMNWAMACSMAHDCLQLGGVLVDGNLVERPDFCFPLQWRDTLFTLLQIWPWPESVPPNRVPIAVVERAAGLATALEQSMFSSPWATISCGVNAIPIPETGSSAQASLPGSSDSTDGWLTVTKASQIAGISTGQISRLCTHNILLTNGKTGRERRIDPASVMKLQQQLDVVKVVRKKPIG